MSLNRVLELSEANMNEGDYLEVANLLRDIHNNTPPTPPTILEKTFIFNETHLSCQYICDCSVCDCNGNVCGGIKFFFKSIKFERRNNNNWWELTELNIDDRMIKWDRFESMLNIQLKSTMSLDIRFFNDGEAESMDFKFEKYMKFYRRRYELRYGDDDDYGVEEVYVCYINFIVEQIKDYFLSQRHII
jgi:hypothetical protein